MFTIIMIMGCALVAFLYATVGHAGASGYIIVLTLYGIPGNEIRSTALLLNIIVAAAASFQFIRAKQIEFKILWPFLITSVPAAFLGGMVSLPDFFYKKICGVLLVLVAVRIIFSLVTKTKEAAVVKPLSFWISMIIGAVLGFVSGLIGIGGGIFLSPILLFLSAAPIRSISGISAVFILANSVSGILGLMTKGIHLPHEVFFTLPAALIGGMLGAYFGSKRLAGKALRFCLALVLIVGAGKLIILG